MIPAARLVAILGATSSLLWLEAPSDQLAESAAQDILQRSEALDLGRAPSVRRDGSSLIIEGPAVGIDLLASGRDSWSLDFRALTVCVETCDPDAYSAELEALRSAPSVTRRGQPETPAPRGAP